MRRPVATLALCLLLVLAGCGGTDAPTTPDGERATATPTVTATAASTASTNTGADGPSQTDTAAGTTTPVGTAGSASPTASPTGAEGAYPPGTDESGVTDVDALVAAHRETLSTAGYHTLVETRVEVGENVSTTTQRVRSNLATERATTRAVAGNLTIETYRNATRFYRNETFDGRTNYVAREAGTSFESYHESQTATIASARGIFTLGNFTATGNTTVDGEAAVVFELDSIDGSAINESTTVERAAGTLVVTRDGLVHSGNVSITAERDGTQRVVEISFEVVARGDVSVERPGWLGEAERASE